MRWQGAARGLLQRRPSREQLPGRCFKALGFFLPPRGPLSFHCRIVLGVEKAKERDSIAPGTCLGSSMLSAYSARACVSGRGAQAPSSWCCGPGLEASGPGRGGGGAGC